MSALLCERLTPHIPGALPRYERQCSKFLKYPPGCQIERKMTEQGGKSQGKDILECEK